MTEKSTISVGLLILIITLLATFGGGVLSKYLDDNKELEAIKISLAKIETKLEANINLKDKVDEIDRRLFVLESKNGTYTK